MIVKGSLGYVTRITSILFLIAFLWSCSDEAEDVLRAPLGYVDVMQKDGSKGDFYRMKIANSFYVGGSVTKRLLIETLYPEMASFNQNNIHRYSAPKGGWGRDRIKIFIDYRSEVKTSEIPVNDFGRFALSQKKLIKEERVSSELFGLDERSSEKITYFDTGYDNYIIRNSDGRITLVGCVYKEFCNAKTTWKGLLSIKYYFHSYWLKDLIELDRRIVAFIEGSEPTHFKSRID